MGRVSELSTKMRSGEVTVQPLSAVSGQGRAERMRQQLLREGKQSRQTVRPVAETTRAAPAPSLTKAKREAPTATLNRAPVQRWENQVRQAQVDMNMEAILRLNRKLKEERARQGKQTLGDRASDVASAVFGGSGSSFTNLAGFASNLVQNPEADRRNIAQARKALQTGRTSDGRPINDAQRKTLEESISRLSASAEKLESPDSFTNRAYRAADRMADTGAAFQESAKRGLGKVGATVVDAAVSMGQSTLDSAIGAATGTGMLPFAARSLGGGTQEARRGGADLDQQLLYGSAQAAKEYVAEKLFGLSAPQRLIGGGSFDDAIEKGIRKATERLAKTPGGQKLVGGLMTWLAGGATEGLEEGIGSVIENALINPNLRDWDPDRRTVEEKVSDGLYDMLVGGVSGLMGVTNLGQYQVSPAVWAQYAANRAEAARESTPAAERGWDAPSARKPAEAPQTAPRDVLTEAGQAASSPGDVSKLDTSPVRAGRVTTIQRPYQGVKPVQAQKSAAVVQVDPGSVRTAQNRINGARKLAADPMFAGQGFKSILKRNLQNAFRSAKGVPVEGVTFEGKPYLVDINRSALGKIISGSDLSAERLSLLDMLPDIVRNGEYIGSGEYTAHGSKAKPVSRYDYFETPVTINGQDYIAKFDVEALPDVNNFRTHQIVKIDLIQPEGRLARKSHAPASGESGPSGRTSSPGLDSTITQGAENVNPLGGDGLGAADAGSLNSDYDRLQAQSSRFHPEGPNAARPVDVPTQDFEGRNISKAASTIMGAEILNDADIARLEQMVADGGFSFDTIHDKDALARAQDTLKAIGFDRALERYTQAAQSNTATKDNTVLGQVLMLEAARGGNRRALAEVASLYARNSTNIAQAMQAQKILRRLGPADRLYTLQKSVSELAEKYNVDIELDQAALGAFMNAESEEARQTAEAQLIQSAAEQLPTSFRAKYDAVRYLAMLGNPRTHIRNILGNIAFQVPATLKNRVGALGEITAQALGADVERTKSLTGASPFGALAKEARADWANAKEFLEGGKYSEGQTSARDIEREAKPFQDSNPVGKFVGWLADKNGKLLEAEDNRAKRWIYSQSLAGYLKANGIKSISEASPELLSRARNYAAQEALRNTFNDHNDVSDFVAKLGNLRNSKSKTARAASYLTEGLLPFKRTPTNVAVRAVEYSPVGAAASIVDLVNKGARGQATAETVTKGLDRLAAGLSGTALFGLGFLLSGMVTGGGDEDREQQAFDDLTGHQSYALETEGGLSVTLDWLAPSAIPFFMGVELAHAMQDGGVSWDDAWNAVKNMGEPMLEMSMLQGLNDVFENAAYAQQHGGSVLGSAVVSAASGYLTQVFPTLLGQMERTTEDRRMTTYADANSKISKDLQFFMGKLSQKVPGWDYQQIPYLDAWGREEETGDALQRAFNNMINPAYVSQVRVDRVERELQRVKDATGAGSVFPERAARYFTVDGARKDLTAEEYQKYAGKRGQISLEALQQMLDSPGYQKLSDEKKAEAIKDVYQYADSMAKMEVSSYRPGDGTIAAGALRSMLPPSSYILYRLNQDRDGDGKVSKMESTQTLQELPGLSDRQRGEAWAAFNDSKTAEARNPFSGVLAKKGLSPEDAQAAWDIYGRSGTKEEPYTKARKKKDLQAELGVSYIDAAKFYELMEKAVRQK